MRPCRPGDYFVDSLLTSAEFGTEFSLRLASACPCGPDCQNVSFHKMALSAFLTPCLPALAVLVSVVVAASSKEKVVGINAQPIVAFMENAYAFRNWPVSDFPCKSMRKESISSSIVQADKTIPTVALGRCPEDASTIRGFAEIAKESFLNWRGCPFAVARDGAEFRAARRAFSESPSTLIANEFHSATVCPSHAYLLGRYVVRALR